MNNDFPHDDHISTAAPAETFSTDSLTNGAAANGASTHAAAGNVISDPAMRDALEDAHALFVRPAQGQGVARGMGSDTSNGTLSSAPSDSNSSGSDSNDAYHRAMGTSGETRIVAPAEAHAEQGFGNTGAAFSPASIAPVASATVSVANSGGAIVPPSDDPPLSVPTPIPPVPHEEEHEQDIWEHLGELRSRILKCVVAVAIAMVATWQFRDRLLGAFAAPIVKVVRAHGGHLTTVEVMDGFSIYIQTTFVAALLLVMPYVLYQVWAFIEPALTHKERRFSGVLVPFSVLLFFVGATFGFYLTPMFFEFFLQFNPPGTEAFWSYPNAATFLGKMLLVFGICFQVPVFTIFVNKIGLVSRNLLIEYWRHVVIVIFVIVAVITPTWDPFTMTAAALPPCILYGVSIWLVKWL